MPEDDAADLTIGRAAARVGVTVRTLHHWDGIGLARPSSRSTTGYRLYAESDLERLRRIVVPAYAAHYDGIREGLASWLRRIIDASARANGIDPDSATWR